MLLKNIYKNYKSENENDVKALNDINVNLESGLIILLGVSGTGKSTLLNIISGLDTATSGEIIVDDVDYTHLSQAEWDEYRLKDIGIVFQESNLIQDLDVYENLEFPLKLLGIDSKSINRKVNEILEKVGLKELAHRNIWQLSAGQRQRIAIARGLIKNPKMLILDEPTGNLDLKNSEMIFKLLHSMKSECLIVVATHDENNANKYADRILTMSNGKIIDDKTNKISKNKIIEKITIQENNNIDTVVINGFDDKSIVELVKNIILKSQVKGDEEKLNIDLKIEVELSEEDLNNTDLKSESKEEILNNKVGLQFRDTLRFAINSLKIRKIRFAITILIFALSISLIVCTCTLFKYEYKDIMKDYMKENNINYVNIHQNTFYKDIMNNKVMWENQSGKNIIEKLNSEYGNVIKVFYLDRIYVSDKECLDIPILIINRDNIGLEIIGDYPTANNDVIINRKICELLFPNESIEDIVDRKVYYNEWALNISGVILNDEIDNDEYVEYGYILGNLGFFEMEKESKQYVNLPSSDLTSRNSLSIYISSKMKYGSQNLVEEEDIIWGKLPENDNDVLISKSLAEQLGYDLEDLTQLEEEQLELINLEAEKYNGAFDCINLYTYFENGLNITGIYETYDGEKLIEADVLIQDSIYKVIRELYYEYYIFDGLMVYVDDCELFLNKCEEMNIVIDEKGCTYIYNFRDFIKNIKNLLVIFVAISFMLALFFLITFISYSIKDQSKKVGILRAMGVSLKDTICIFLVEAVVIIMISLILGFVIFKFILCQINNIYCGYMLDVSFNIINTNYILCLVIACILFVMSFIAIYLPLYSMSQKRPIELLNK